MVQYAYGKTLPMAAQSIAHGIKGIYTLTRPDPPCQQG
jgi:hypothetical protein